VVESKARKIKAEGGQSGPHLPPSISDVCTKRRGGGQELLRPTSEVGYEGLNPTSRKRFRAESFSGENYNYDGFQKKIATV
jgi:hypothetical protein